MCTYKQNKTWSQHEILILYWKLQQHKIHAMKKSRNKRVILFYKAVHYIDPQSNWSSFCSLQNWKWQSLSSCAWSVHALIMDTLDTELAKTRKSNVTKLVTTQPMWTCTILQATGSAMPCSRSPASCRLTLWTESTWCEKEELPGPMARNFLTL
jgi:hypothetical protein